MSIKRNSICEYDRRLIVLTNIPTPYRTQFFNRLNCTLMRQGIGFGVLFCAQTEFRRHWAFVPEELRFDYRILKGIHPRIRSATFHLNPTIGFWLNRWKPTWLLSAGAWLMPTGILALAFLWRRRCVRLFWSEGHEDKVTYPSGWIAGIRRRVLRCYDSFAVPNRRSADFLARELGTAPLTLPLPNTVDDNFFVPPTDDQRVEARSMAGIEPEDLVLVQVGQLEDLKGVRELVAGWSQAALEHKRLRLVLVGAGQLEDELRAAYADAIASRRLLLTGAVPPDSVRRWLHAADAFILASKRDSNPLSAIEAALTGLPLLLSEKAGNFEELCKVGATGLALHDINPTYICNAIAGFAALSPEERVEMGRRSRDNATYSFATDMAIEQFVSALIDS